MGKTVKTVMKIAAGAAIAVFAPMLAPALLAAVGTTTATALATTVASAAIGAAAGEASGIGWKAGAFSGFGGGAQSSGLFGGAAAAAPGATTAGTAGTATTASLTPGAQAGITSPALTSTGGAIGTGTGLGVAGTTAAGAAPVAGAGLSTAGTTAAAAAPATLGAKLGAAATQLGNAGLAGLKATAPQLAASMLVGNPGGALAKAQQEELLRAQQSNASLTQARLSEANKLISEAGYYDPEYMGRQAAEAAAIRGGLQATEETRGLTGSRLDAERRRYKLGTARNVGTAYQQGFGTGAGARTQTRAAGISAIPNEYPMTSPTGALYAQNAARTARDTETQRLSALFAQALGRDKAKSAGPLKPEEEDAAA